MRASSEACWSIRERMCEVEKTWSTSGVARIMHSFGSRPCHWIWDSMAYCGSSELQFVVQEQAS